MTVILTTLPNPIALYQTRTTHRTGIAIPMLATILFGIRTQPGIDALMTLMVNVIKKLTIPFNRHPGSQMFFQRIS